ncbi:hypothetical protein, partial [Endozoicomonas acroporae]|uniref:hypothetical protein n=1 Tax=Endozoicomonas acroporae TaxID=1701104 RepID=UPI003D7A9230
VPPYIISAYFDFITSSYPMDWNLLTGIRINDPVVFVVGEQFLEMPGLNANTNTFIYSLAGGGIIQYFKSMITVALVFGFLDMRYESSRNPMLIFVGFLYAILITEQAATTALVSSGVALLLIFTSLAEEGAENKAHSAIEY